MPGGSLLFIIFIVFAGLLCGAALNRRYPKLAPIVHGMRIYLKFIALCLVALLITLLIKRF
jgi:hypothetical protein